MSKPTTGQYSIKPYASRCCGYRKQAGTNHWGAFYNTPCKGCGEPRATWDCLEDVPDTHDLPEEWKPAILGEVVNITELKQQIKEGDF